MFNYKLTERSMFTSTVWTDDSELLQESNLTARQPRRALITLSISVNKRRRLAIEALVNFVGIPILRPLRDANSGR